MTKKLTVHHIGYMVKNIEKSQTKFEQLGFIAHTKEIIFDPDRICYFLFMSNEGSCVELIQPKDETSPIFGLSKRYKNMPYHICYETSDLNALVSELTVKGFTLIQPSAKAIAIAPNAHVAFLMSADIGMIELVEI